MKEPIIYRTILLLIACMLAMIFSHINPSEKKVVVLLPNLDVDYWKTVRAGVKAGFKDFDVEGEIIVNEKKIEHQIELLEEVLKEEPDVVVIAPVKGSSKLISCLEKFRKRDIPILFVDRNMKWGGKTAYIGTNNEELGVKTGLFVSTHLDPGDEVALIGKSSNHPFTINRMNGAMNSLNHAGIRTIHAEVENLFDANEIKKTTRYMLSNNPHIDWIIAPTDATAFQIMDTLKELDVYLPVTGADGTIKMLTLVEKGEVPGAIAQNPYDIGYLSIETALKASNGEEVKGHIDSGVDILVEGNVQDRIDFLTNLMKKENKVE